MDYWQQQMANGMSQDQIRQMFDQSQEGQAYNQRPPSDYFPPMPEMGPPEWSRGGIEFAPVEEDMRFLRNLYQQELGRKADQGGMDYWQQQMAGGMGRKQIQQMFDQSQEGQTYNQQPPRIRPMHPEIEDALRLANQRGQQSPTEGRPGGGVGGPHMEQGLRSLLGGMLPPQPSYNPAPPTQEEREYSQRLGKDPFSPEVQDALRIAKGLPVY
jgi:hypothetical protein